MLVNIKQCHFEFCKRDIILDNIFLSSNSFNYLYDVGKEGDIENFYKYMKWKWDQKNKKWNEIKIDTKFKGGKKYFYLYCTF